jgi:exonuclease III
MPERQDETLSIIQYNTRKSYEVIAPFMRHEDVWRTDIIAIQEPWINAHNGKTYNPVPDRFMTIQPDAARPRVCWYVNKRIKAQHVQVTHHTRDLSTLRLTVRDGGQIHIHNVYNPPPQAPYVEATRLPTNSTLPKLDSALLRTQGQTTIVVGDFNAHHETWNGDENRRSDQSARALIDITTRRELELLLEQGTPTRRPQGNEQRSTTIDLAWGTTAVEQSLIEC